eukprot:1151051-Pelagomonas_calceolata.AAC.2
MPEASAERTKAFRLGKFLQDVNAIRHSRTTGYLAILELIAYGGEGVYYFIEQLAWGTLVDMVRAASWNSWHGAWTGLANF